MKRMIFAVPLLVALLACAFPPTGKPPLVTPTPLQILPPPAQATISVTPLRPPETPAAVDVTIYLILMGDDGATGRPVGCGDSGVVSIRSVPASDSPLRAAMTELLTDKRETDDAGLYNSLVLSDLVVDSAEVGDDGTARVALSGDLVLTGVCEDARIQAQLEETARQFSPSQDVEITINGSPLADLLSGQG